MTRPRFLPRLALLLGLPLLLLLGSAGCGTTAYDGREYYDDVSYLSGYGEWIHLPGYGLVWQPYSRFGWAPFGRGQWVWTPDGWAWASQAPFGWLVDHYGDWGYHPDAGWFWTRGDRWSPAPGVRWRDLPERERRRIRERVPADVAGRIPDRRPEAAPSPTPAPRPEVQRPSGRERQRALQPRPPDRREGAESAPQVQPRRPERRQPLRPERRGGR